MRPVRICQLLTSLAPAGPGRCVCELSRRLAPRRFDVQVVALRGGALADWLKRADVPVTILGSGRGWDLLKMPLLTEFLRRERIDLVHTHLFHADIVGRPAACLAGVRHVVLPVHATEGRIRRW